MTQRAVSDESRAGRSARRLKNLWPVLVVVVVAAALMYPLALLLGLPQARLRMENYANWVVTTSRDRPLAVVPSDVSGARAGGEPLQFKAPSESGSGSGELESLVLVREGVPLDARFTLDDGEVSLSSDVPGALLTWGDTLLGPLDVADDQQTAAGAAGRLFRFPQPEQINQPLYLNGRLLQSRVVESAERADGVTRSFTFALPEGAVMVGEQLLTEDVDYVSHGLEVELERAPPFNARVRRITGDYAVVDASTGLIALVEPSSVAPRAARQVLSLAETLVGAVDGVNRTFSLQHAPLVETDADRRLMLDGELLSATAERPAERVDGATRRFTFTGERGIVTVNGAEQAEGVDYSREGNVLTFTSPPPRNATLRQYQDYLVNDLTAGRVKLAVAPPPGSTLWAASYSYYDYPACGNTALECFFTMPQHPMPFPHWIAARLGPFIGAYPISDSRSVVRATMYTAGGTLVALLLGGALGVLLAIVFVAIRPVERALLPWVIASQTVPIIALVPVLLLLLGNTGVTVQTSLVPAALIGAYIAFFPVTVGTVTGLRSVDPLALDLMRSYAASPFEVFWKVRFPAAVPFLFTSLKLGTAAALVGALVAETESNNRLGLGYSIVGQVQAGNVSDVWILLMVSAFLGIGLVALVGLAQRLLAPWERR